MIVISFLYIAAILIGIWAVYRVLVLKRSKERNILREVVVNVFFIYFLIVINLTICKMGMLQISFQNKFYINYIPFIETVNMFKDNFMGVGNALYNVFGNIFMFVPLGFFIPLLFEKKNKILNIVLYALITSLTIELIQLFTAFNLTDIDDIIFNTLGAVLGLFIYNVLYFLVKKTKIDELIKKITSEFDGNLVTLCIKPISFMVGVVLFFTIINIYNSTIPSNVSNEDIAKSVFKYSDNADFEAVKEFSGYKLFLKDEGDYLNLMRIERAFNNRWGDKGTGIGQYQKSNGDYNFATIYENTLDRDSVSMSIVVFGKNKNANNVEIIFNGKNYIEKIEPNEYFLVTFPSFETLNSDEMDNVFGEEESEFLNIRFLDSNGNDYKDMKFAR